MKSKFMRMVGSGKEEPEEEIKQEKVLPQISDAEIDGFYDKFLSTGFTSPYVYDKRKYVLDMYLRLKNFLTQSNLSKEKLVGGATPFESLFRDMAKDADFSNFLKGPINEYPIEDYNDKDIEVVLQKLVEERNKIIKEIETDNYKINILNNFETVTDMSKKESSNIGEVYNPKTGTYTKLYKDEDNKDEDNEDEEDEEDYSQYMGYTEEDKDKEDFEGYKRYLEQDINKLTDGKRTKKQYLADLEIKINLINQYLLTSVSPKKDILDTQKYEKITKGDEPKEDKAFIKKVKGKEEYKIEDKPSLVIKKEDEDFFDVYGVEEDYVEDLYLLKQELGVDDNDLNSGEIIKAIQNFKDKTDIRYFVEDLIHFIKKGKDKTFDAVDSISKLKTIGIKINKKLVNIMEYYENGMPEWNDDEEKKNKKYRIMLVDENGNNIKRIDGTDAFKFNLELFDEDKTNYNSLRNRINKEITDLKKKETKDKPNYLNSMLKDLFVKTLKFPLLGNMYFDIDGDLLYTPELRRKIFSEREFFVNSAPKELKGRYSYDNIKEVGNIYEYYEAMKYQSEIARYVAREFNKNGHSDEFCEKVRDAIVSKFQRNINSLDIVYGYYYADIDRIDNKIEIKDDTSGKTYTVFIETKGSGRVSSISSMNTFINKLHENDIIDNKSSYDAVYTGSSKLLLLLENYFDGENGGGKNQLNYCYNTLYFKDNEGIFNSVMSNDNFNIKPSSSSMLSIQQLVKQLKISKESINGLSSIKKSGRKKIVDEEEEDEETKKMDKQIVEFLRLKFVEAGLEKNALYNTSNYESIYLGIPALFMKKVLYNLDIDKNKITFGDEDENLYFKNDKFEDIQNYLKQQQFIKIHPEAVETQIVRPRKNIRETEVEPSIERKTISYKPKEKYEKLTEAEQQMINDIFLTSKEAFKLNKEEKKQQEEIRLNKEENNFYNSPIGKKTPLYKSPSHPLFSGYSPSEKVNELINTVYNYLKFNYNNTKIKKDKNKWLDEYKKYFFPDGLFKNGMLKEFKQNYKYDNINDYEIKGTNLSEKFKEVSSPTLTTVKEEKEDSE